MAHHYYEHKSSESPVIQTNNYFLYRIKRLYPAYLIALIVILYIYWAENAYSLWWLGNHLWNTKWQYIFLHYLCPNVGFDLRNMWYMSSFVFVMYIIYFLLAYDEKLMMGVFPIVSIIILTHMYATYGTICVQSVWEGWLSGGTLRGFAEMALGAFLYNSVQWHKTRVRNVGMTRRFLNTTIKWASLLFELVLMRKYAMDVNDFVKIFLFVIFIYFSYCECYECNLRVINDVIRWLGKINYWIYCIHLIISHIMVTHFHYLQYKEALLIYLTVVTTIASICQYVEDFVWYIASRNAKRG